MQTNTPHVHPSGVVEPDERYDEFLARIRSRFDSFEVRAKAGRLFHTDAADGLAERSLFNLFLDNLPAERRQHYNCRACRRFVDTYGDLVVVTENGAAESPFWGYIGSVPPFFLNATTALMKRVNKAKITSVFLTTDLLWGLPSNEGTDVQGKPTWHHMHVVPPASHISNFVFPNTLNKRIGEINQGHEMLTRAVGEYTVKHVEHAIALLESGAFPRPERFLPTAKWFLGLLEEQAGWNNPVVRSNLLWRAAALAPNAFLHFNSSGMLGTLLQDVKNDVPQKAIIARFSEKAAGDNYMRPKAAPTEGNIAQAEKLVKEMGLAPSLERRFLRLEEVASIWTPKDKPAQPAGDGVFGHLRPAAKTAKVTELPTQVVTWRKLREEILPKAERMEFVVPSYRLSLFMFVTAVHPDAPPILQWDLPQKRNPVSWYFRDKGAEAGEWGLTVGSAVTVRAITVSPPHWHDEKAFQHQATGAWFILDGAKDVSREGPHYARGGGFFVESLKGELHGVRSTLAAYAKSALIAGIDRANANGIAFIKDAHLKPMTLRVYTGEFVTTYVLDRWD